MEIFKEIFAHWFYIWLVLVPLIIFSVRPSTKTWIKSGRIIFLISMFYLAGWIKYHFFIDFFSYEPKRCCESSIYYFVLDIAGALWIISWLNMYVGWWEFLWRCIYRQWAWPPLKNIQYGIVSNLCILGSLFLTVPATLLLIVHYLILR